MLCGTVGNYNAHLRHVADVIGRHPDVPVFAAMNGLLLPNRTVFICDTYVNRDPTAEQLVEIAGSPPRRSGASGSSEGRAAVALELRQRRFAVGAQDAARRAALLAEREPGLEMDGEMHGDAALSEAIRNARASRTRR